MQYLKNNVYGSYFCHNSILNKANKTKISIRPKTIDKIKIYLIGVDKTSYKEVAWEATSYNGPVLENAEILKNMASINDKPKKLNKQNDKIIQKIKVEKNTQTFKMTEPFNVIRDSEVLIIEG